MDIEAWVLYLRTYLRTYVGRLLLYIDGDDHDSYISWIILIYAGSFFILLFSPNIAGIFELVLTGLTALSTENGS